MLLFFLLLESPGLFCLFQLQRRSAVGSNKCFGDCYVFTEGHSNSLVLVVTVRSWN